MPPLLSGDYPPAAFYFTVSLGPLPLIADSSFREVGGIGPEMDTETVAEGGENRFVHVLPKSVKHPRLVLKRGIATIVSPLVRWCKGALEGGLAQPIEPKLVHVFLLDESSLPLRAWSFENAYPVKWEVEGFQSMKNEVALEKIELVYAFSKREL